MKKLWLLLLVSNFAWATYSPGTFVADPTTPTTQANVKAASTAAVAADKALVVAVSPNNNLPILGAAGLALSGSVSSATTVISQDCSQYQSVSVQMTSIGAGNTINFQVSNDNVNWFNAAMMPAGDLTAILTTSATAVGGYTTQLNSRYFRVNVTSYSSGTITANAYFKTFGNAPNSVGGYVSALTLDGSGNAVNSTSNAMWVTQQGGPWTENLTQVGSNAVLTGTGASGTGSQRVSVANDSKVLLWDSTNTATVKAASTAPVATDTALVVVASPNQAAIPTKQPVNANATLSATQSVTTTESNLVAPANSVGCIFESDSTNTANVRWGFSNSTTAILSSTLGLLMEPGRDAYLPVGAGTYIHLISISGTQSVNVQWVLSQ